jgi:short-subunit dehydrogenase
MKNLGGKTALLTGGNGGLGIHMARALAEEKMNLLLVAYPESGLEQLQTAMTVACPQAKVLVADLRLPAECTRVVRHAEQLFGSVDVLVNNAAMEFSSLYHELSEDQVRDVLAVNLQAPMLIARLVLAGMVERKSGHIVNISSLAGKSGPACQEPYVATKAALTAFTFSLRATYRGTGVSASVVWPGFVEAGIYERIKARTHRSAPALLSGNSPERVARAVVRAVRQDVPELIVNRFPVRPALALSALSPALGAWVTDFLGVNEFFRNAAGAQKEARKRGAAS